MSPADASIANWDDSSTGARRTFIGEATIATESAAEPDPKWDHCVDALLGAWRAASSGPEAAEDAPTRETVEAALAWLKWLIAHAPAAPPTLITSEPGGGIILERAGRSSSGDEYLSELTLYNSGQAEFTVYVNGRVVSMEQIPFAPEPPGSY